MSGVRRKTNWASGIWKEVRAYEIPLPRLAVEPEMVSEAVRQGHQVLLCSHRFTSQRAVKRDSPRVRRYDLEQALRSSGFSETEAERLAREFGGSLTILKRIASRYPATSRPQWGV